MKEPLYPVELTPEVLKELKDDKDYMVIYKKNSCAMEGKTIKDYPDQITHIYLPSPSTPLKQLSEITDEDVIEIIKLLWNKPTPKVNFEYWKSTIIDFITNPDAEYVGFVGVHAIKINQYLQFKGYDVPQYYPVSKPKQLSDEEIENMAEEKLGFNSSQEYYKKWMEGAKCVRDLLSVSLLKEEKTVPKLSYDDMYDSDGIMKPEYAKAVRDTLSLSPQSDHINPIELLEWQYNLALTSYKAAIDFTDIDTDATRKSFVDWFKKTENIDISNYFRHIINYRPYSEI